MSSRFRSSALALALASVSACDQQSSVEIALPEVPDARTLLVLVEDTSRAPATLLGGQIVDLESGAGLADAEALARSMEASVEERHLTAFFYELAPGAFHLEPGPLVQAGEGEDWQSVPPPQEGFRMRIVEAHATPWREFTDTGASLAGLRLPALCLDQDGDGFGLHCQRGEDCDDQDIEVYPGAPERCNDKDDNCDLRADEGLEVGEACYADSGNDCYQRGHTTCESASGVPRCIPASFTEAMCCPAGETASPGGNCCLVSAAPECQYECVIDLEAGTQGCRRGGFGSGPIRVVNLGQTATVAGSPFETAAALIDMDNYEIAELTVTVCDPTDWVLHIGDSPTNNGGGGDAGSSSNDAELQVLNADLALYGRDGTAPADQPLLSIPDYFDPTGCTTRVLRIEDQRVVSLDPCVDFASPDALRLEPPSDTQGVPDGLWYVGLNRTFSGGRTGTGVVRARFCLIGE